MDNSGIFLLILTKEIPESIFFFKMADFVRAEVWAAKTKAFLLSQALISRVSEQSKFKLDEGGEFKWSGTIILSANDRENAEKYSPIKKMADPTYQCPR